MKTFKILDPVFKTEPLFVTNCTAKQLSRYLKRRFGIEWKHDDDDSVSGTQLTFSNPRLRVVWFEKMSKKPEDLAVLIHELFHLVVRVCRDKGVPIVANIQTGDCGDESAAYMLENYFTQCLKKL